MSQLMIQTPKHPTLLLAFVCLASFGPFISRIDLYQSINIFNSRLEAHAQNTLQYNY